MRLFRSSRRFLRSSDCVRERGNVRARLFDRWFVQIDFFGYALSQDSTVFRCVFGLGGFHMQIAVHRLTFLGIYSLHLQVSIRVLT